jgi:hypothetical protein
MMPVVVSGGGGELVRAGELCAHKKSQCEHGEC